MFVCGVFQRDPLSHKWGHCFLNLGVLRSTPRLIPPRLTHIPAPRKLCPRVLANTPRWPQTLSNGKLKNSFPSVCHCLCCVCLALPPPRMNNIISGFFPFFLLHTRTHTCFVFWVELNTQPHVSSGLTCASFYPLFKMKGGIEAIYWWSFLLINRAELIPFAPAGLSLLIYWVCASKGGTHCHLPYMFIFLCR